MARWALDLENVRAGYGETVVLEDVRFALGASETVSIIGRNGVGKTTLLATIMGHTTLHGGRLSLHDKDISKMATYRRVGAGLGYLLARLAGGYIPELHMPTAVPVVASAVVLLAAAVIASYLPAARAARVDVIQALRSD